MTLLSIEHLSVAYGDMLAVQDVSFAFDTGEVFVLLGANGAGKTSILRCISAWCRRIRQRRVRGRPEGMRPHQVARIGVAHVPEGRRVFPNLSVEENLIVSFIRTRTRDSIAAALERFTNSSPATRTATPAWRHAVGGRAADAGDWQGDDEFPRVADAG